MHAGWLRALALRLRRSLHLRSRPMRAASIGEFAARTSSWSPRSSNFIAWKKCCDVGQRLPRSVIGYSAKFDSSPYSALTL